LSPTSWVRSVTDLSGTDTNLTGGGSVRL
jgi:hypothetical protein